MGPRLLYYNVNFTELSKTFILLLRAIWVNFFYFLASISDEYEDISKKSEHKSLKSESENKSIKETNKTNENS